MNNKLRPVALILAMSFAAKIALQGASWQEVATLGLLAGISLVLQGINDKAEREVIMKEVESLRSEIEKSSKILKDNSSALTALKMNNGITTRRL